MLTEAQVEGIKAQARVQYIADGRTGLRLRVYPSGVKKWILRTEIDGKTRERVIGEWPSMPVREARKRVGVAPKPVAVAMTFEQAARRWHADRIVPRYRASADVVWRYLERDCRPLFTRRLDSITRRHIASLVEAKKADGHNAASKLLRLLRKFFRWASAHELVNANPMESLDQGDLEIRQADPRDRLATDIELRKVWNLPAPHGPMLRFTLLTACRIGEARAALPEQVTDGIWTHGPTKNGRMHSLPLSRTAAAVLVKGWELRSPEALYHALKSHVPGLNPHDLRRTAATRMRQLGVSSDTIDAILNHTAKKLHRTYQLPDMKPAMRAALLLWERELLRIVKKK